MHTVLPINSACQLRGVCNCNASLFVLYLLHVDIVLGFDERNHQLDSQNLQLAQRSKTSVWPSANMQECFEIDECACIHWQRSKTNTAGRRLDSSAGPACGLQRAA